jgi:hypothetical protein
MAVFLGDADIQGIINALIEPDATREHKLLMPILIGQAKDSDASTDTAGLENQVITTDIGDIDAAFDQRGIDLQYP